MLGQNAPQEKLIESRPDALVLLQLWWAVYWRRLLWFLLVIVAMIFVIIPVAFILAAIGIDKHLITVLCTLIGAGVGAVGAVWTFIKAWRQALKIKFSGYQFAFLTRLNEDDPHKMPIDTNPEFWTLFTMWWSLAWREVLWVILGLIVTLVPIFMMGTIIHLMDIDQAVGKVIMQVFGYILGFAAAIFAFIKAFRQILGMAFRGRTLVCLTPRASSYID
jgi:hypothetical protein